MRYTVIYKGKPYYQLTFGSPFWARDHSWDAGRVGDLLSALEFCIFIAAVFSSGSVVMPTPQEQRLLALKCNDRHKRSIFHRKSWSEELHRALPNFFCFSGMLTAGRNEGPALPIMYHTLYNVIHYVAKIVFLIRSRKANDNNTPRGVARPFLGSAVRNDRPQKKYGPGQ